MAGDVVLAGPGGEGLAGGLPGLRVEGAEVGDDLLLGAASGLAGRVEGRFVAGAPTAQQPAHLLLGQAERCPRRIERRGGVGAGPLLRGGRMLSAPRRSEGLRRSAEVRAGPGRVPGEDLADPFPGDTEEVADLLQRRAEGVQAGAAAGPEVLAPGTGQHRVEVARLPRRDDPELLVPRHAHQAQHVGVRDAEHGLRLPPGAVLVVPPPGAEAAAEGGGDHCGAAGHDGLDRGLHRVRVHIEEPGDLAGHEALLCEVERTVGLCLGERQVLHCAHGGAQVVDRSDGHRFPFRGTARRDTTSVSAGCDR